MYLDFFVIPKPFFHMYFFLNLDVKNFNIFGHNLKSDI